jgi:hypothetical protein
MRSIVAFLLLFASFLTVGFVFTLQPGMPTWIAQNILPIHCVILGGLGGAVYCLRGVYLNASVKKQWDPAWLPWYYTRPFVSLICGGISYLFLRAGLLVLESKQSPDATDLGFYALAFVSGLNVDKFITKIEDVAQATWGIEKSRTAKESSGETK